MKNIWKIENFGTYALVIIASLFVPIAVHAQNLEQLILNLRYWLSLLTPAFVGIALIAFFWGLVRFIYHAGDEEKRKEGKKAMAWSIIAMFVVVSIWGIVIFIAISLGVGIGGGVGTPCIIGMPNCILLGGY